MIGADDGCVPLVRTTDIALYTNVVSALKIGRMKRQRWPRFHTATHTHTRSMTAHMFIHNLLC